MRDSLESGTLDAFDRFLIRCANSPGVSSLIVDLQSLFGTAELIEFDRYQGRLIVGRLEEVMIVQWVYYKMLPGCSVESGFEVPCQSSIDAPASHQKRSL